MVGRLVSSMDGLSERLLVIARMTNSGIKHRQAKFGHRTARCDPFLRVSDGVIAEVNDYTTLKQRGRLTVNSARKT